MFHRLTLDQVNQVWPLIIASISKAWPPNVFDDPKRDNNLLEDVLKELAQVWIICDSRGASAIAVTNFVVDHYTKQQSLQILAFVNLLPLPDDFFLQAIPALKAFAKANRCLKVIAYSTNHQLIRALKESGAETIFRFIEIPVLGD